jgi:hypothetical protein
MLRLGRPVFFLQLAEQFKTEAVIKGHMIVADCFCVQRKPVCRHPQVFMIDVGQPGDAVGCKYDKSIGFPAPVIGVYHAGVFVKVWLLHTCYAKKICHFLFCLVETACVRCSGHYFRHIVCFAGTMCTINYFEIIYTKSKNQSSVRLVVIPVLSMVERLKSSST